MRVPTTVADGRTPSYLLYLANGHLNFSGKSESPELASIRLTRLRKESVAENTRMNNNYVR